MRGQGHDQNHSQPRRGGAGPPAEIVCVELWIERADEDGGRVSVELRAYGYDDDLRNDYEIAEASAGALAEPYGLDLLRLLLTSDLAEAVAQEMGIACRRS
jgi:hypothetical protein